MKILGIELAPLNIPFERRLQTLVVAAFVLIFLQCVSIFGFSLLISLLFTRFYWISLLYAVWYVLDRRTPYTGGRAVQSIRKWPMWRYFGDYFPVKLIKTVELSAEKNYILGISPHGIMCFSAFVNFATEGTDFSGTFPGLTPHLITLEGQFLSPLMREFFLTSGACAASRDSLAYILNNKGQCKKKGQLCALLVGGARYLFNTNI
jgi:hypothetical protein